MAKNETGTDVYVHNMGEDGKSVVGTTIVHPGKDFPGGFSPDASLTTKADDAEVEIPGPGQFPQDKLRSSSSEVKSWSDYKVPQLRDAIDKNTDAGLSYTADDRKDDLVAKLERSGLDPNLHGPGADTEGS